MPLDTHALNHYGIPYLPMNSIPIGIDIWMLSISSVLFLWKPDLPQLSACGLNTGILSRTLWAGASLLLEDRNIGIFMRTDIGDLFNYPMSTSGQLFVSHLAVCKLRSPRMYGLVLVQRDLAYLPKYPWILVRRQC